MTEIWTIRNRTNALNPLDPNYQTDLAFPDLNIGNGFGVIPWAVSDRDYQATDDNTIGAILSSIYVRLYLEDDLIRLVRGDIATGKILSNSQSLDALHVLSYATAGLIRATNTTNLPNWYTDTETALAYTTNQTWSPLSVKKPGESTWEPLKTGYCHGTNTGNRPTLGAGVYYMHYDRTLNRPIWWDGDTLDWRDADGVIV